MIKEIAPKIWKLNVDSNVDIDGQLDVLNAVTFQNTLDVTSTSNLADLNVSTDWITGTTRILDIANKIQRNADGSKRLFGTEKKRQWLFQDEDDF